MAETLLGCVCTVEGKDRNIIWRWFTDPGIRLPYPAPARAETSRMHVADLRAAASRRGNDDASSTLVDDLHRSSDEFARLWERHEVAHRGSSRIYVQHASVGLITLDVEPLVIPAQDQRLHIITPTVGGTGTHALAILNGLDPRVAHAHHEVVT